MKELAFYLGLGTLLTHEIDAALNHEWRVMPGIRALPDDTGMAVFVAAHIPIFAVLLALAPSKNPRVRRNTRAGVALFLVFHGLLHLLFSGHPAYEFSSPLSSILIYGGAVLGVGYLALDVTGRRGRTVS